MRYSAFVVLVLTSVLVLPCRSQEPESAPPKPETEAPAAPPKPETTDAPAAPPKTTVAIPAPRLSPPDDYYLAFDVSASRSLWGPLEATALGKLFADESVQAVWEMLKERVEEREKEIEKLMKIAEELDVDQGFDEEIAKIITKHAGEVYPGRLRVYFYPYGEDDEEVAMIASLILTDDDLPKIRESVQALADKFVDDKIMTKRSEPVKLGDTEIAAFDSTDKEGFEYRFDNVWFFIDGNELFIGMDSLDRLRESERKPDEKLDTQLARAYGRKPGLAGMVVNVAAIVEDAKKGERTEIDKEFMRWLEGLGVAGVRSVSVGLSVDGEHFRETLFAAIPEGATGVLEAFRAAPKEGAGSIPALPAPKPVLAQIDGSIDVPLLIERIISMTSEPGEEREQTPEEKIAIANIKEAFGGGFSLSISAPHLFSLVPIPRLVAAVDVASEEKFGLLLELVKSKAEGIGFTDSEHNGETITTVFVPNNPSPLVPTFARVGKAFYLADSPKTLQKVIDALKKPADDPTEGAGALADNLELGGSFKTTMRMRYSPREIYNAVARKYVPLIQLGMGQMFRGARSKPLLAITEMPKVEKVIEYLGDGTAELAWGPGGLYGVAKASTGDPLTTIALSIYAPLAGWIYGYALDEGRATLERQIVHKRVAKIKAALKLYRGSFGGGKRFPRRLSELLDRGLIEDPDVFVVPSDDERASLEYENEDGEILEAELSYKYLPASKLVVEEKSLFGFSFDGEADLLAAAGGLMSAVLENGEPTEDGNVTIILYELDSNRHGGRIVLTAEGGIYHVTESLFDRIVSKQ